MGGGRASTTLSQGEERLGFDLHLSDVSPLSFIVRLSGFTDGSPYSREWRRRSQG